MKILSITIAIIFTSLCLQIRAQSEEHGSLTKRIDTQSNSANQNLKTKTVSKEKLDNLANPQDRVTANTVDKNGIYSPSTPATKTNSNQTITEINYSLDNQNGTLHNLLNLIEIKEKVNSSNNQALIGGNDYNKLMSDISNLRKQFDHYIETKGIENCSQLEQSHYLAFLKEENKEKEYQAAIAKLK